MHNIQHSITAYSCRLACMQLSAVILSLYVESLDGRDVNEMERQFLFSWKAMRKARQQLTIKPSNKSQFEVFKLYTVQLHFIYLPSSLIGNRPKVTQTSSYHASPPCTPTFSHATTPTKKKTTSYGSDTCRTI